MRSRWWCLVLGHDFHPYWLSNDEHKTGTTLKCYRCGELRWRIR